MNELTHLDLCTGFGGFALAAEWSGFRTVGFSEIEPYACKLLKQQWPNVPNVGDLTRASNFSRFSGRIVAISAGYPCQPFSFAGIRKGEDDDRHLWPSVREIVQIVRPTWIICENVLGHVSLGLDTVLSNLESDGYASQPFIVPAAGVGAWHNRDRVWIISHSEQKRRGRVLCRHQGRHSQQNSGWQTDALATNRYLIDRFRERVGEPVIWRVPDGIPNQVVRLEGLGNAIVPQIAEKFFSWIAQIETGELT